MKKIISFFSGALMGSLVGATVAILLAPSSGDELRREIHQRAASFQDEISQAASSKRIQLEKKFNELKGPKSPAPKA